MILPSSTSVTAACSSTNESSEIFGLNRIEEFGQGIKATDNRLKRKTENSSSGSEPESPSDVPVKILWPRVVFFASIHLLTLYGFYLAFTSTQRRTIWLGIVTGVFSGLGVTAGAHRLWAHRSYKAKLPLRIFLAYIFTIALESHIYEWCRDHRVHHKYSETDADPYNSKRGFFFSHVGWLMCRKHPDVRNKGQSVDCSDLLDDPVVRYHRKYYNILAPLCSLILPTLVPMYFWNETFVNSLTFCILRICISHNLTWLVNSAAHMYGYRPYDINISPRENILVTLGAMGEGFHNYHHTFPIDYATSEYGMKYNLTTAFIDLMASLGLAYDRKTTSKSTVQARKLRTGMDTLKKTKDNKSVSIKDE